MQTILDLISEMACRFDVIGYKLLKESVEDTEVEEVSKEELYEHFNKVRALLIVYIYLYNDKKAEGWERTKKIARLAGNFLKTLSGDVKFNLKNRNALKWISDFHGNFYDGGDQYLDLGIEKLVKSYKRVPKSEIERELKRMIGKSDFLGYKPDNFRRSGRKETARQDVDMPRKRSGLGEGKIIK